MRSKEKKECYSLILIESIITYISALAIFNVITDYVRSSIRLTGGRQIDFKVFKPLNAKENILEVKFKIPKIDRVNFIKSKQIFSQKVNKYFSSTN